MEHAVDELFAQWSGSGTPGASIAVIENGKIIYSKGYGSANLEYGVPNTPATVFHLASVSKQFTGFAIYLLAQDGKLSLDDDVRKYVPKLHDFGKVITIRQLLHHTSGMRDQWELLALAGWRLDDEITDNDVARLLFQ
jgi:CubicO group peptidase (beta-lactamase class C family)